MNDSPERKPPTLNSEAESIGVHHDAGAIAGETLEPATAATSSPDSEPPRKKQPGTGRSAFFVGAGILISRIVGLIRQRIFAHYFGTSAAGDAFSAAWLGLYLRTQSLSLSLTYAGEFLYRVVQRTAQQGQRELQLLPELPWLQQTVMRLEQEPT